jgi:hypothetical protein
MSCVSLLHLKGFVILGNYLIQLACIKTRVNRFVVFPHIVLIFD